MSTRDVTHPRMLTSHFPLLLAILILASVWIYYFTNWFPVFGSVLGFGGVLVVVPVLRGLMIEERRRAYADLVDRALFQSSSAVVYLLLLLSGIVVGFGLMQPLRIAAAPGGQAINLRVTLLDTGGATRFFRLTLEPNSTFAMPLRQPFLGGTQAIRIVAEGLPQLSRDIGNFAWPRFSLPAMLWSEPVVVLRPEPDLLVELSERTPTLTVTRRKADGEESGCVVEQRYLGEPVWLGGGSERIEIDDGTRRRWIAEFEMHGERTGKSNPEALKLLHLLVDQPTRPDCIETLSAGDTITWKLETPGGVVASGRGEVASDVSYPQEIILRAIPGE
jgi:hypothetical protein